MNAVVLTLSIAGAFIGLAVGIWVVRDLDLSPIEGGLMVCLFVAVGFLFGALVTPLSAMVALFWLIGKLATIGVKA